MASSDQPNTQFLKVSRVQSIKTKILVFSLLATIIPSVVMGWFSYVLNRQFLSEKINQELKDVTSQASRELDLWFKERVYDIRVFSSSYVVSENLEKIFRKNTPHIERVVALRRLKAYLKSVREKFVAYEELMLLDLRGKIVATSADHSNSIKMPDKWQKAAKENKSILGKAYWDETLKTRVRVMAEPIRSAQDQLLGVLAAKLNFITIGKILRDYSQEEKDEVYLVTEEGSLLVSSKPILAKFLTTKLPERTAKRLFRSEKMPLSYVSYAGKPVVGTLKRVHELGWGVVAEMESEKAYARIVELRNLTLGLLAALLICIGLCAYILSLTIVRPLVRLTKGADKVATGDLEVDVPTRSRSEVGYLTQVFNHMVMRLRRGRKEVAEANEALQLKNEELHELSITDSLTGLHNRKHLMETLEHEMARCVRHERTFALLIIDIDHFKKYNDTYGHLAGDEVLRNMRVIFQESIRSCDYAARYGGEEFIIILPEIGPKEGVQAAERIRLHVAEEEIEGDAGRLKVTVSIGVASFPKHGDEAQSIISRADAALYKAKESGRNRVVLATKGRKKKGQSAK
ncbi:MAG: diguanylate cyclase [Desulfobacteraceae bacterium]|nr:diguanylate cyclase [Desulfobacteraceae bacterium]